MSKKKKKIVVDRAFLNNLADLIHDPATGEFLRLCNGTLQNGPDPTDEKRPMHCGLGELYFEMTGRQPEDDGVSEEDVVQRAVELSTLPRPEETKRRAVAAIKAMKLPKALETNAIDAIDATDDEEMANEAEEKFRDALDNIPGVNDDGCATEECTVSKFRNRSRRVATQIRKAAKHLPA